MNELSTQESAIYITCWHENTCDLKIHISSGAVGPKKAEIQDLNRTTQTGQNEEYDIIFPGLFYFPENREFPGTY